MSPIVNAHRRQGQLQIVRPTLDDLPLVVEVAPREIGACRDTPLLVIPRRGPADNDATCEDPAISPHDIESWPRHALAANGFGDVATAAWPTSYHVCQAARGHRARALGAAFAAVFGMVWTIARRVVAWHQQHQRTQAVYDLLRGLDDHLLRDLGFDRSYIAAAAREASGADASAGVPTFWTSQGLPK